MSRHLGADTTEIDATILFVLQILSDNFRLAHCEYTGLSEPMGRGDIATSELADQFTLSQPGRGQIMLTTLLLAPPPQCYQMEFGGLEVRPNVSKIPVFKWFSSCLENNLSEDLKKVGW